jgi:hypothetical protein
MSSAARHANSSAAELFGPPYQHALAWVALSIDWQSWLLSILTPSVDCDVLVRLGYRTLVQLVPPSSRFGSERSC